MEQNVLIVEDSPDILAILNRTVHGLGLKSRLATEGQRGLELALLQQFDLLLIDVNLPLLDGFELVQRVREVQPRVPIILVTSRSQEQDRVKGLDLGADDYIIKPFSAKELEARIKALLRRAELSKPEIGISHSVGDIRFDVSNRQVFRGNTEIKLTTMEFDLLYHLSLHPGKLFTREELMSSLWGYESQEFSQSITTYFSRLRAKLEVDPKNPEYIQTIHGKGYRFTAAGSSTPPE